MSDSGVMKGAARQDSLVVRMGWLSAARLAALALAFLLPLILVRKLSLAEFGLYKQAFQILSTALALLGLQFSASVYYFLPRHPDKKAQVVMNTVIFYGAVGTAVALWFGLHPRWVTAVFQGAELAAVMPALGGTILLWLMASSFEGVMIADADVRRASVLVVALQVVKTSLLVCAAVWRGDVRTMVWAALVFGVIHCAVFGLYLQRRFGVFPGSVDWRLFRAQLANSLPFGCGAFVAGFVYDLHNYFVSHYYDSAAFAVYANGWFQLPLLIAVLESTEMILTPEVARLEKEARRHEIVELWMGTIRTLAFCFMPACVLMFLLRRELIAALFTEKFLPAAPIFAVALINLLLLTNLTGAVIRAFDDLRFFRLRLYLGLLPLMLGLLYVGNRAAGLRGVIAAVVLARLIDVTLTTVTLSRRLEMRRADVDYLPPLLRIAAAALLAAPAAYALRSLLTGFHPLAALLLCATSYGLAYPCALLLLGAVTAQEKEIVRKLAGRYCGTRSLTASA